MLPFLTMLTLWSSAPGASEGVLRVTSRTRNDQGHLLCSLFDQAEGYPGKEDRAIGRARAAVSGGQATCVFTGLAPGRYAVATLHDENDDLAMNTNLVGIPKEGFGASRDAAPGLTGPPSFADAAFDFDGGSLSLSLKLRYWTGGGLESP